MSGTAKDDPKQDVNFRTRTTRWGNYYPVGGDRAILRGVWYDYDDLLDFIYTVRQIDTTVRSERILLLERLNSLGLRISVGEKFNENVAYVCESQGDWLTKLTRVREYLTLRGTNKGNTSTKNVTNQQVDDADLSNDEIYSFWKLSQVWIKELEKGDYVYTTDYLDEWFNYKPPGKSPE